MTTLNTIIEEEKKTLGIDAYNTIGGEICCWRCGLSKKEARYSGSCYTGWGRYDHHLWKAPRLEEKGFNI